MREELLRITSTHHLVILSSLIVIVITSSSTPVLASSLIVLFVLTAFLLILLLVLAILILSSLVIALGLIVLVFRDVFGAALFWACAIARVLETRLWPRLIVLGLLLIFVAPFTASSRIVTPSF